MSGLFSVVVTWNGVDWLPSCLGSLRASPQHAQMVVVDNASADGTLARVRSEFPEALCIALKENLGFGRANNVGIRLAHEQGAEHVFLLNQDAWVEPDTLGRLIRLQQAHSDYGVLSPVHWDGGGGRLDGWFSVYVSKAGDADGFLSDVLGGRPMKDVYQVPFVNAAAWLVSRRCVETVGLFNPVFEHYGEDMEYADRVRHHGLRVGIAPAARVCHGRENRGLGRPSAARALVQDRATIRYRLARHGHPTRTNVLSALFYSVASGGHGAPWPRRWAHRARLLGGLIAETPRILQSRHITASQGLTFFESAAEDARRYFVDQQGLGRRER